MRNAIFMMLLAVVSSSAAAEWITAVITENITTYADPATIRRAGDMVKMWHLYDYKTVRAPDGIKPYMSIRVQAEYDCKEVRARLLSGFFHSGNMAGGEIVYIGSDPGTWTPIPPNTIMETLWKIACGRR
jgi:hypothetical protein